MSTDNESGATVGNAWRGDDAEHINKHAVGPGDFKAPGKKHRFIHQQRCQANGGEIRGARSEEVFSKPSPARDGVGIAKKGLARQKAAAQVRLTTDKARMA